MCFKEALEQDPKESEETGGRVASVAAGLVVVGSVQTAAQQEDPPASQGQSWMNNHHLKNLTRHAPCHPYVTCNSPPNYW